MILRARRSRRPSTRRWPPSTPPRRPIQTCGIEQSGEGSTDKEVEAIFESDLKKAGTTSLPITLLVLLIAFGALVAAGIPLLLAITAVIATIGIVAPLSQLAPVDDSVSHVILLIGLAVGVDYSLFYLRRVREERAAGRSTSAAIDAAAATSGRAVLISGITVMIAMAGMYFGGAATFTSFATGTIAVVAVAMLGSLTVLPAVLSLLGDRVDKGRVPGLDRLKARVASRGLWSRLVDRVMRRPLLWASLTIALLLALAAPALDMSIGSPAMDTLPQDLRVVQKYNHLQASFPSETSSLDVVIRADDVGTPAVTRAVAQLEAATHRHPEQFPGGALEQDVNPDGTVNTLTVEIAGDGTDEASGEALDTLRENLIPATLGQVAGLEAYATGGTAVDRDFNDSMIDHLPLVFGFVILAAFLLLLITFRSIVIPIKAIVLNLLSVAAAYGAMVLVFQHGWFNSAARDPRDRPDRILGPAVPVRRAVRPVDGLPRVHPQPGARAVRAGDADRGCGRIRDQEHRRGRDERRSRHGLRVRDLRDALVDDVQADGPWPGVRHPARRHAHPRGAAAREHEGPR